MADDVIIQAQSTDFQRSGITLQERYRNLPTGCILNYPLISNTLNNDEAALIDILLTQDNGCLPGGLVLQNVQAIVPDVFEGSAELQTIYRKDPFSTTYETSTTALYDRGYATARSIALSGPTNVRGGTARQGFELAELDTQQAINRFREIWQNQLATAQVVITAVQVANATSSGRRELQLKAQQLQAGTEQGRVVQALSASEALARTREGNVRGFAACGTFFGSELMRTTEALEGMGSQEGGSKTAFGTSYWR